MKRKTFGLILLVVLCLFALWGLRKLPSLQLHAETVPREASVEQAAAKGSFEADSGVVLAAETQTRELYLDTGTLDFRVEDKKTGTSLSALKFQGSAEDESPLRITFVGEDGTFLNWNAYEYCIKYQTYTLEQIENGFRMNLNLKESDSNRINEYVPQKISIERYEQRFVQDLADKVEEGAVSEEEAEIYRVALSLVYGINKQENCYYNKLSLAPPISTVNQIVRLTKLVGYTTEELMEDNAEFGITVTIEEPASFLIPVEVVLDGEDLVVSVNTDAIVNENPYYTLTRLELLPCLGAASVEEAEEGYIFVPDGCGALLSLNHFNPSYGTYSRAVYDNTYYNDYYYMPSYPETLHMPVFGMYYEGGSRGSGGFLAIIEEGDDIASITATLASADTGSGGSVYNRVYSGLDVSKYAQVSILGPYDSSGGLFLESTGTLHTNYKVRYKLYTEQTDYYEFASAYRDYLMEKYGLTPHYGDQAKLYLEATGALSVTERILGLPYEKTISMTTYRQLEEILEDLAEYPLTVSYLGMFDGGLDHKLMNHGKLSSVNGSAKDLKALRETAADNGQELFWQVDFTNVYQNGNGFQAKTHASYNFNDDPIELYRYSRATGIFVEGTGNHFILSPKYLSGVVEDFLKKTGDYEGFYVEDLAKGYYADYNRKAMISPMQAQKLAEENLGKLSEGHKLALNNPEIDKIAYGSYAVNIARESSGYGAIEAEIPFRQLVMNGLIDYTTVNVNESGIQEDYFLLQALELGSSPKFTITGRNLDVLKNTEHSDFISREYGRIAQDIKDLYDKYEEAFAGIQCMEIAGHRLLADGVFETTYANGVRVMVNYNMFSVTVEEQELKPLGYLIR